MANSFYTSSAWRRRRLEILERDGWRCQIQGPKCLGEANEVDHKAPISMGGSKLDPSNLRAACRPCNLGRIDRTRREQWRNHHTHIHLVWGPPAAGKTTWVQEHAAPGDLIVDYDLIAESLGAEGHDTPNHDATLRARNAIIESLRRGELDTRTAWIVSTNPQAPDIYPHHTAHLIDPGPDHTHRQADQAERPAKWHRLIDNWYTATTPTPSRNW